MKAMLKSLAPPITVRLARKIVGPATPSETLLFDGDDACFRDAVSKATCYGEYGCGASTRWVAANTMLPILAVDTALAWIQSVASEVKDRADVTLHWADLGRVGDWGRPVGYTMRDTFTDYTDWIWSQPQTPDCVLVDGRFRVCCFATPLNRAVAGTTILFDDYADRAHYHIVESVLRPVTFCGRQAVFEVPDKGQLDLAAIDALIADFRCVMD